MNGINDGQKCEHKQFFNKTQRQPAQFYDGVSQYLILDQKNYQRRSKMQFLQSKRTSDSVSQSIIHQNSTFGICYINSDHGQPYEKNEGVEVQKIKHIRKNRQNQNINKQKKQQQNKKPNKRRAIKDPDYNQNEQPKNKPSYNIKSRKKKKQKIIKQNRKNLKKNAFQQIARGMKSCLKKKLKSHNKLKQQQQIGKYKQNRHTIDSILNSIELSAFMEQIFINQQIQRQFKAGEQQRLFNIAQLNAIRQKFLKNKLIESCQKDQQIIQNQQ